MDTKTYESLGLNTSLADTDPTRLVNGRANREITQADQKVGASAYERFTQLMKEWTALKADAEAALR